MPRPKGSQNKLTKAFKTALVDVFEQTGGTAKMAEWAKKNRTEFYKIMARLIPHEVVGPGKDGEHLVKTIQHVHERASERS